MNEFGMVSNIMKHFVLWCHIMIWLLMQWQTILQIHCNEGHIFYKFFLDFYDIIYLGEKVAEVLIIGNINGTFNHANITIMYLQSGEFCIWLNNSWM